MNDIIKESNNTTRNPYVDGRGFLHQVESGINVKLQARLIGNALEFKVKDPTVARRLGRNTVLVSLLDLLTLAQEVDTTP